MQPRLFIVPLLLAGLGVLPLNARAAEPPQLGSADYCPSLKQPIGWRGDGTGRFVGAAPVTEWSPAKNIRWVADVGGGYASPIAANGVVLVSVEPSRLVCLDQKTGRERWRVDTLPGDLPDEASRGGAARYRLPKDGSGMAAATPVTDGRLIYVVYANGIVRAVDLAGRPAWIAYLDAEPSTSYGRSASPIIAEGKLIVHMTNLYAFDPATGKQLWVNSDAKSNYGTPVPMRVGETPLIVTSAGDVVGLDDGKTLNTKIGQSVHGSPVVQNDVVFFGGSQISAIRLTAKLKDKEVWSAMLGNDVIGSPLLTGDMLFANTVKGELSAFALASRGSPDPLIDARPLFGAGDDRPSVYASLTLAGKYIFLSSNDGQCVVLEATREASVVAHNRLPPGSGASPFFSGGDMLLCSGDKLYAIAAK